MRAILAGCVLFAGCALHAGCQPVFRLQDLEARTCPSPFLATTGGLTFHVENGPGDGSFDYLPEGSHVERVAGAFDLRSGELAWDVTYRDHERDTDRIAGMGTLWQDGDLDITYRLVRTFEDQTQVERDVRIIRLGCEESTRVEDLVTGVVTVEVRTWDEGGATLAESRLYRDVRVEARGRESFDGSSELEVAFDVPPLALSTVDVDDGDGTFGRSFDDAIGQDGLVGSWEHGPAATTFAYVATPLGLPAETWTYSIGHDGVGEGTWTDGTETCDLVFEGSECTALTCAGSERLCRPPVSRR